MPRSRSTLPPTGPRAALDALLAGPAGDPLRRALMLDALDRQLRLLLPPPLPAHARLANINGNRLVFVVDSPVWHAKLRLAAPRILDAARSIGLEVDQVGIKTATRPMHAADPSPTRPLPSARQHAGLAQAVALLNASAPRPQDDPTG